jgi:hypothetical protein
MAKRPPKQQQQHSWAVYHLAARQKLVGIVHDQPNTDAAIKQAIEEYNVPPKPDRGAEAGLGAALPMDATFVESVGEFEFGIPRYCPSRRSGLRCGFWQEAQCKWRPFISNMIDSFLRGCTKGSASRGTASSSRLLLSRNPRLFLIAPAGSRHSSTAYSAN